MSAGTFLVLEGPDGAGTTSHAQRLADALQAMGKTVCLTAEPTNGSIGRFIREALKSGEVLSPAALQLLFCADRAEHVASVILPALKRGEVVISDRYALSTLVYGAALGLDSDWLKHMNGAFPAPTLTLLLLPPLEVCLERVARRAVQDVLEATPIQTAVHAGYSACVGEQQLQLVDTSGTKEDSAARILAHALRVL